MKTLIKSIRLTLVFCVLFSIAYVAVLWGVGQIISPAHGNVKTLTVDDRTVGAENIGQKFTRNIYFWGRPSCAGKGYEADKSAGSNKGPTNEAYLREVASRIDSFLLSHPYLSRAEVPAEMVTASGSGLDPHISPEAAYVQVKRVAMARNMSTEQVLAIVEKCIERPLFGVWGPTKVNVLRLNIALDNQ